MNAFKCRELLVTLGAEISIMMVLISSFISIKMVMHNALISSIGTFTLHHLQMTS